MKHYIFNFKKISVHSLHPGGYCLIILITIFQISLFSQQGKAAEYQRMYTEAGELQQKAQEAFDAGKYAEGQDYAEKAAELAAQVTAGQLILLERFRSENFKVLAEKAVARGFQAGADTNSYTENEFAAAQNQFKEGSDLYTENMPFKTDTGVLDIWKSISAAFSNSWQAANLAAETALFAFKAAALLDEAEQGIDFLVYNKTAAEDSTEITLLRQQAKESRAALEQRDFAQSISISEDILKTTVVLKKKQEAEFLYAEIKQKILEAKNMNLEQNNKETFAQIADLMLQIDEAMKNSQWDQSIELTGNVREWLAKLNVPSLLPAAYTVRFIPRRRDCLWRIAEYAFVYSDGKHWTYIYEANKSMFRDRTADLIFPGEVFKIPSLTGEERSGKFAAP